MNTIKTIDHVKVEPTFTDSNGLTKPDVITGAMVKIVSTEGIFEESMATVLPVPITDLSTFITFESLDNATVLGWLSDEIDPIVILLEAAVLEKVNRTVQIRTLT
jgi:hypothetical protein